MKEQELCGDFEEVFLETEKRSPSRLFEEVLKNSGDLEVTTLNEIEGSLSKTTESLRVAR
jgi:hypothetical protein